MGRKCGRFRSVCYSAPNLSYRKFSGIFNDIVSEFAFDASRILCCNFRSNSLRPWVSLQLKMVSSRAARVPDAKPQSNSCSRPVADISATRMFVATTSKLGGSIETHCVGLARRRRRFRRHHCCGSYQPLRFWHADLRGAYLSTTSSDFRRNLDGSNRVRGRRKLFRHVGRGIARLATQALTNNSQSIRTEFRRQYELSHPMRIARSNDFSGLSAALSRNQSGL